MKRCILRTKIWNQKYFEWNEFSKFKDFLKESLSNLWLWIPKWKIDKVEVKTNIKNSKLQKFNFKLDENLEEIQYKNYEDLKKIPSILSWRTQKIIFKSGNNLDFEINVKENDWFIKENFK